MVTTIISKAANWAKVGIAGCVVCVGYAGLNFFGLGSVPACPQATFPQATLPQATLPRVVLTQRRAATASKPVVSESSGAQESTARASVALVLPSDSLPATEELLRSVVPLGLAALPVEAIENRPSPAQVELGRRLFFDPILSADRTVSCATCHQPDHGLASPEPLAIGIGGRVGRRNAPSLFNRVFGQRFFWDGRAESLEAQSLLPIANPDEMGDDLAAILLRLAQHPEYPALFVAAFPMEFAAEAAGAAEGTGVTADRLAAALAAFQRTLLLGDSPVDRFRAASDVSGLSLEARQGLWIFESRGRCWQCHSGENFSDEQFHNTGVGFGADNRDLGRFEVTGAVEDRFRFKTPSLRGVAETPPYMHDGSVRTLEDVVEFYNRGGAEADRELSPMMRPLNLSDEEKRYLVEFLKALSYQAGPSTAK